MCADCVCAAQQYAERSRYEVQRSEFERQAAVVRAEGESEAAKMVRITGRVPVTVMSVRCVARLI